VCVCGIVCFSTDYVLKVSADSITVNENGTRAEDIIISETGYTFGNVNFTMTPLTYTQYQSITGRNLDDSFPLVGVKCCLFERSVFHTQGEVAKHY